MAKMQVETGNIFQRMQGIQGIPQEPEKSKKKDSEKEQVNREPDLQEQKEENSLKQEEQKEETPVKSKESKSKKRGSSQNLSLEDIFSNEEDEKKYNRRVTTWLDDEEYIMFIKKCKEKKMPYSKAIRTMIRAFNRM